MSPLNKHSYDVIIVGSGFSGSMVAVHLSAMAPENRVLILDRGGAFGRGVAYGTDSTLHLLNVPAGKISAFPGEPDHFCKWLQKHGSELATAGISDLSGTAFVPRQLYGQYVRDLLEGALASAPRFKLAQAEAIDIKVEGERLIVVTNDGTELVGTKVVLALGNFTPGDPPTKDRRFHQSARYLNSPWSPEMVRRISQDEDVLILGAGLTALDLILSLEANHSKGKIHVVSRRGLFPQSHLFYTPKPDWFDGRQLPHSVRGLLRFLRDEIRNAEAEGIDWRAIIDALRPHAQHLWRSLNLEERRRFMRHVRPYWESHRHRVAPAVLDVKSRLEARGQLLCYKASVVSIIETDGGLDVTLRDRTTQKELALNVDYVLNCSGPECNYYKLKDPLVVNLLAAGVVHPDPLFLGLMTATNGAVLNYLGQPSERIFTLGSVKKGMLFETTAVPELRDQAKALAEELARSPKPRRAGSRKDAAGSREEKIVLVSNRGPNDFIWDENRWVPRTASGGLVSMIDPLARQPDVAWFCCVSQPPSAGEARGALFTTASDQVDSGHHLIPVPLPARVYQAYYGAISNEVLWMLQHHLVGQFGYSSLDAARHHAWNEGYLEANRRMVVAIRASGIKPRAFLIQDYHFYPLPALLRKVFPNTPILHYTHIPFPDPATLKLIPQYWRDTILKGLLGADVVGMQTQWDTRPFLGCCEELLGARVDYASATVLAPDGRIVRVRAFPASTDPAEIQHALRAPGTNDARQRLAPYLDKLSIIRVDRLDPSKNQIIGFNAFGRLLEMRPDLRGSVRFLAFLVPSRTDLTVYRDYRDAVYQAIDEVNRRFAPECGFEPIQVFYVNDREQALAAMEQCNVLLANSREDGMNLVVKEWAVASERPGVAIISETAGVASELGASALLVSPLDIEGTAHAMAWALDMPGAERQARLAHLRSRVQFWTAAHWLSAQSQELKLSPVAAPTAREQNSSRALCP